MQFVPGRHLDLTRASAAQIARLGRVVGSVHALPVEDLAQVRSTSDSLESYAHDRLEEVLSGLAWVREPVPASVRDRLNAAAGAVARGLAITAATGVFRTGESLVLLHGDPAGDNILWDAAGPVLIDWEYTRLGDPADEVAYLFDQNDLSAQQREAFWRGYRDGSSAWSSDLVDRVSWWEPATLLGSTLWWVERWVRRADAEAAGILDPAVSRALDYYSDGLIRRLDRLDSLLARQ
jgi:thiamine kinase-like enzyme